MPTETVKEDTPQELERPSGVPGPHKLGESSREGLYVVLALVLVALIGLSFWFEATH